MTGSYSQSGKLLLKVIVDPVVEIVILEFRPERKRALQPEQVAESRALVVAVGARLHVSFVDVVLDESVERKMLAEGRSGLGA